MRGLRPTKKDLRQRDRDLKEIEKRFEEIHQEISMLQMRKELIFGVEEFWNHYEKEQSKSPSENQPRKRIRDKKKGEAK